MAIQMSESFQLFSQSPLDSRVQFGSIAEMSAIEDYKLYDGIIATIVGDEKHKTYQWWADNENDEELGKWRELSTGGDGEGIDIGDLPTEATDEEAEEVFSGASNFMQEKIDSAVELSIEATVLPAIEASVDSKVPPEVTSQLTTEMESFKTNLESEATDEEAEEVFAGAGNFMQEKIDAKMESAIEEIIIPAIDTSVETKLPDEVSAQLATAMEVFKTTLDIEATEDDVKEVFE